MSVPPCAVNTSGSRVRRPIRFIGSSFAPWGAGRVTDKAASGANSRAERTRRADVSPSPSPASGLRAARRPQQCRRRQAPGPTPRTQRRAADDCEPVAPQAHSAQHSARLRQLRQVRARHPVHSPTAISARRQRPASLTIWLTRGPGAGGRVSDVIAVVERSGRRESNPSLRAWKALVQPLHHARVGAQASQRFGFSTII
jgi:hypothetical protein